MGKKKSSGKSKEVLVDEEALLLSIENQEFVVMMEDRLHELVSDGLI
jgi:hypothetical protein